jgi:hypothetical protein
LLNCFHFFACFFYSFLHGFLPLCLFDELPFELFLLSMLPIDDTFHFSLNVLLFKELVVELLNFKLINTHYLFFLSFAHLQPLSELIYFFLFLYHLFLQLFYLAEISADPFSELL